MKLASVDGLNSADFDRRPAALPIRNETHHSLDLLQRTQQRPHVDAPDPRYWTAYDHFMLEREARARRREYVYGLIAKAWRRLSEQFRRRRKLVPADGTRGS